MKDYNGNEISFTQYLTIRNEDGSEDIYEVDDITGDQAYIGRTEPEPSAKDMRKKLNQAPQINDKGIKPLKE